MRKPSLRTELERAKARIENGCATVFQCECVHNEYPSIKLSTTLSASDIAFSKEGVLEINSDVEYMLRKRVVQKYRKNTKIDVCDFILVINLDADTVSQLFYERYVMRERDCQRQILEEQRKIQEANKAITEAKRTITSLRGIAEAIHRRNPFRSFLLAQHLLVRLSEKELSKLFKRPATGITTKA